MNASATVLKSFSTSHAYPVIVDGSHRSSAKVHLIVGQTLIHSEVCSTTSRKTPNPQKARTSTAVIPQISLCTHLIALYLAIHRTSSGTFFIPWSPSPSIRSTRDPQASSTPVRPDPTADRKSHRRIPAFKINC